MLAACSLRLARAHWQAANGRTAFSATRAAPRAAPRPLRHRAPKVVRGCAVRPAALPPPAGAGSQRGGSEDPKEAARRAVLADALQKMQQSLPAGLTPLTLAAQCGTAGTVRELLAQGQDPAATDPKGHTALIFMAMRPSAEVVAALLEAPSLPRVSAAAGHAEAARVLVGADGAQRESPEATAQATALLAEAGGEFKAAAGTSRVVTAPEDLHAVVTRIMEAADKGAPGAAGDWDVFVGMLATGAKFSMPGGVAALHLAVMCGNVEAVNKVVAAGGPGVDVDGAAFEQKLTPLHLTVIVGDRNKSVTTAAALVGALLAAGANPNARDTQGRTPLHLAAATGQLSTSKVLLEGGAQADLTDAQGRTPLDLCTPVDG